MSRHQNHFTIVNAKLYDGTGSKPYMADVTVENGVITAVGPAGTLPSAGAVIDAGGCALTPGFIDAHSHSDNSILKTPLACSKISQGITTEIVGHCGFTEFNGKSTDLDEYEQLYTAAAPSMNIACMIGHNTLRLKVLGWEKRIATAAERAQMKGYLEAALEQGAAGMTSGLWYIPGVYSDTEEVCEVASALRGTTKPYATHMRSEGDRLLEAIEEAVTIAKAGSGSLLISHFKACNAWNWHKKDAALALVEKYRAEGMDILADRYPYLYTGTALRMALPPPYDSIAGIYELLHDNSEEKQKVIELFRTHGDRLTPWDKIIVIDSDNPEQQKYCGKTVADVGVMMGLTPEEAYVELISNGRQNAAYGKMCVQNLRKLYARDWVMPGSDSSSRSFVSPICHPREYGTMPLFFRYACESAMPENVIYRMTGLPAKKFNLKNRGTVAPGFAADLVLLQPDEFDAPTDYAKPDQMAQGVSKVFVNGELVFTAGNRTDGVAPGAGDFIRIK